MVRLVGHGWGKRWPSATEMRAWNEAICEESCSIKRRVPFPNPQGTYEGRSHPEAKRVCWLDWAGSEWERRCWNGKHSLRLCSLISAYAMCISKSIYIKQSGICHRKCVCWSICRTLYITECSSAVGRRTISSNKKVIIAKPNLCAYFLVDAGPLTLFCFYICLGFQTRL